MSVLNTLESVRMVELVRICVVITDVTVLREIKARTVTEVNNSHLFQAFGSWYIYVTEDIRIQLSILLVTTLYLKFYVIILFRH